MKPHCVSPLTVAERQLSDGTVKLRLCWDGSRHINELLDSQKVKLSHLQKALEITRVGDWQTKYDLKSAYFHIAIHEAHKKFLGAAFEDEDGRKRYFQFKFLPFGLASAVHCITKLLKPINAYFHKKGIRHTIFIDDGRIVADTKEKLAQDQAVVYETLTKAGWIIEKDKSDELGSGSTTLEYLGFEIDSVQMRVSLTTDKKESIKKAVKQLLSENQAGVKVKEVARLVGKIISAEPALGKLAPLATRATYIQMEPHVDEFGWKSTLVLNKESVAGLKFLIEQIDSFNRCPIRTTALQRSVLSIVGPPSAYIKNKVIENHIAEDKKEIWASDASAFAVCAYSCQGEAFYFREKLSDEEKELSSGHRELLAVKKTLFHLLRQGFKTEPCTIYWVTDSENLTTFLAKLIFRETRSKLWL